MLQKNLKGGVIIQMLNKKGITTLGICIICLTIIFVTVLIFVPYNEPEVTTTPCKMEHKIKFSSSIMVTGSGYAVDFLTHTTKISNKSKLFGCNYIPISGLDLIEITNQKSLSGKEYDLSDALEYNFDIRYVDIDGDDYLIIEYDGYLDSCDNTISFEDIGSIKPKKDFIKIDNVSCYNLEGVEKKIGFDYIIGIDSWENECICECPIFLETWNKIIPFSNWKDTLYEAGDSWTCFVEDEEYGIKEWVNMEDFE